MKKIRKLMNELAEWAGALVLALITLIMIIGLSS